MLHEYAFDFEYFNEKFLIGNQNLSKFKNQIKYTIFFQSQFFFKIKFEIFDEVGFAIFTSVMCVREYQDAY